MTITSLKLPQLAHCLLPGQWALLTQRGSPPPWLWPALGMGSSAQYTVTLAQTSESLLSVHLSHKRSQRK